MKTKPKTFQLRVSLAGSEPEIWRRILIPSDFYLSELHILIQLSMGWEMEHLYEFRKGKDVYGKVDANDDNEHMLDDDHVELSEVFKRKGASIQYIYDFGDAWLHNIVLEKTLSFESDAQSLSCIGGERACPPEDVGGIWRYNHVVRCLETPRSVPKDERLGKEELEWLGDDFKPAGFSCEEANERLEEFLHGTDEDDCFEDEELLDEDVLDEDLWNYDPDVGPDAGEWLEMDETEQMLAVLSHHKKTENDFTRIEEMHMHAVVHASVEAQVAGNDPQISRATLNRLQREGLDRHEAVHAVGAMLGEQLYAMMKEKKPFDQELYARQLESLSKASWLAYCERIARKELDS